MSHIQNIKFGNKQVPIHQFEYSPGAKLFTFYQICQYKNPLTEQYNTRKIVFNECGEIKKVYERQYKKSEIKDFLRSNLQNKYKIYPTIDISSVGFPNPGELLQICSSLANNNCKQYDYSIF